MRKKLSLLLSALLLIPLIASCKATDLVGSYSISSFDAVLKAMPDGVTADTSNGGWSLAAPDGSARFIWSMDFSASPRYDVMLEVDAKPFLDAGLDPDRLPEGLYFDEKITVGAKLGNDVLQYNGEAAPLASYEQIVTLYRSSIGYHTALDHFNVMLGGGNMFEWAKDMTANDKDIVFVLDPQIFIDAGVDPNAAEGWIYADVPAEDMKGKPIEVRKLLKPINLM